MARLFVRLLLLAAALEAISWLGLLAGMYVKYFTDAGELGVQIFGPIHGGVFVAYLLLTLGVARILRWPVWVTLVALACSVPPFATLAFEWWAVRSGRLSWSTSDGMPGPPPVPAGRAGTTIWSSSPPASPG